MGFYLSTVPIAYLFINLQFRVEKSTEPIQPKARQSFYKPKPSVTSPEVINSGDQGNPDDTHPVKEAEACGHAAGGEEALPREGKEIITDITKHFIS